MSLWCILLGIWYVNYRRSRAADFNDWRKREGIFCGILKRKMHCRLRAVLLCCCCTFLSDYFIVLDNSCSWLNSSAYRILNSTYSWEFSYPHFPQILVKFSFHKIWWNSVFHSFLQFPQTLRNSVFHKHCDNQFVQILVKFSFPQICKNWFFALSTNRWIQSKSAWEKKKSRVDNCGKKFGWHSSSKKRYDTGLLAIARRKNEFFFILSDA